MSPSSKLMQEASLLDEFVAGSAAHVISQSCLCPDMTNSGILQNALLWQDVINIRLQ
jgi:hypothetical protein